MLHLGASSHRCKENGIEQLIRSHPIRVLFNPPATSQFNSAETVISIVKAHVAKALATHPTPVTTEIQMRSFLWAELQKVRRKLQGSRVMYSILPELIKALNA